MNDLLRLRARQDRIILHTLCVLIVLCWLFSDSPKDTYLCDPISLALTAFFTWTSYALNYVMMKRKKVPPTDRGRMDDIRFQANGYGEHILRGYGKFRAAGFLLDATSIIHTTSTTPGRSGGKGAPKPPEPATINHIYTTTLDIGVCESLGDLSPDLKITRIWENLETFYDTTVTTDGDAFYEAERPGNTLAGGATTVVDAAASGGEAASLPTNGSVQFNGVYGEGSGVVEIYYRSTAANTADITLLVSEGPFPETLQNSGGEYVVYRTAPFPMLSGFTNTIKVKNTHASTLYVDRICVRLSGRGTGAINPHMVRSPADDLDTIAIYGDIPEPDIDGTTTTQVVTGGNANIRIYSGSETQNPDSAFVAIHGAGNVPAYRGLVHVVFDSYVLKEPALPNFNFEVDTGVFDVDVIVEDLYGLVNVDTSARVDVSALSSLTLGADEGFLITSREEAARWLNDLMTCFQFDMPEVDGKAKAVLRSGSSVATISSDELRAHWAEEEAPDLEVEITDADPLALPGELAVGYMSALNDYHTNVQTATIGSGVFGDRQTVNLSMILRDSHARQLSETILYQRHMEARTFKLKLGPKYQKLYPCLVLTVNTTNASHTVRIGEHRWQLMGPQEFEGVRHAASVYTQSITGTNGDGYEPPVIAYPGNTKLLILDLPLLRPEDGGDGTQPVVYIPTCLMGEGTWRGAFLFKERPKDSGSYTLECPIDTQATIGVIASGTAGTIDKTVWDRSTSFVVDLYPDATLSSATESDCNDNPELNLFCIGSMSAGWYIGQFTTATPGSASSPYQSRYTISGILWDRFGSGAPPAGSLVGLDFVLLDSAIKPRPVELTDIGVPRNYKATTSGQSTDVATALAFTCEGNSLKPLASVNITGERDEPGSILIQWRRRSRIIGGLRDYADAPLGEERDEHVIEIMNGSDVVRTMTAQTWMSLPALLEATDSTKTNGISVDDGGFLRARSIQRINSAGNFIEATLSHSAIDAVASASIGVIQPGADWQALSGAPYDYIVSLLRSGGAWVLRVSDQGGTLSTLSGVTSSERVRITFSGSEIRFYRNWVGSGTPPFYVTPTPPVFPLHAYAAINGNGLTVSQVANVVMTIGPQPATIYSASQQTTDFGSAQDPVTVRIYQVSGVVGRGFAAEATI